MLTSPSVRYASFPVRLRRAGRADSANRPTDWEWEVEHIQTGERRGFDTLDQLLDGLRLQTEDVAQPGLAAQDCV
jgi:hypothetical protein